MFFVHHDKPQILYRSVHGRPRADSDALFSVIQGIPGFVAFPLAEPAVQHRYLISENAVKSSHGLWSQADFGHQYQPTFAGLDCLLQGMNINLGLAAARDTVQQEVFIGFLFHGLPDTVKSLLLFVVELLQLFGLVGKVEVKAGNLHFSGFDDTFLRNPAE